MYLLYSVSYILYWEMVESMAEIHMAKRSYDGYCVGTGVEYPGIVVSATSDEELVRLFTAAIPSHQRALKKYGIKEEPDEAVITIDPRKVAK